MSVDRLKPAGWDYFPALKPQPIVVYPSPAVPTIQAIWNQGESPTKDYKNNNNLTLSGMYRREVIDNVPGRRFNGADYSYSATSAINSLVQFLIWAWFVPFKQDYHTSIYSRGIDDANGGWGINAYTDQLDVVYTTLGAAGYTATPQRYMQVVTGHWNFVAHYGGNQDLTNYCFLNGFSGANAGTGGNYNVRNNSARGDMIGNGTGSSIIVGRVGVITVGGTGFDSFSPNTVVEQIYREERPYYLRALKKRYFLPAVSGVVLNDSVVESASAVDADIATNFRTIRPASVITQAGWTDNLGGSALAAAIDEVTVDDSDYIQSANNPTNDECEVKFAAPGFTRDTTPSPLIHYRIIGTGTGTLDVSLYCGATLIKTWSQDYTPGTFEQSLTSGEIAAITDDSDLRLRFKAN